MKTAVCCWHRTASGQLNDQMIPFYQQITHIFSWMILKGAPLKTLLQKMIFCSRELGKDESNLWGKTFLLVACCNLTLSLIEFLAGCLWEEIFFSSRYISPFVFHVKPTSPGKHHKTWDGSIKGWFVEANAVLASWMSLWVTIWQLAKSSVCGIVLFLLVP